MKKRFKKAFSLIEISIVILIIGILIAGITQASRLVTKFKIRSAQTLTKGSPVAGIKDLVLWFDVTTEGVLTNTNNSTEVNDGDSIKNWVGINPQQTPLSFSTSTAGTYPLYSDDEIKGLPALKFDGVNDFMETTANETMLNDLNNFTIFMVASVGSNASSATNSQGILTKLNGVSYITGITVSNPPISLHLLNATSFRANIAEDNSNTLNGPTYSASGLLSSPVPVIMGVSHDSTDTTSSAFKIYLNGGLGTSTVRANNVAHIVSAWKIGQQKDGFSTRFAVCNISEIIIFSRVLLTEERREIEQYLSKKWSIRLQ